MPVLAQEAYIGNVFTLFNDKGELINEGTAEFLKTYGKAFSDWIDRVLAAEMVA